MTEKDLSRTEIQITEFLRSKGTDFIHFADISSFPEKQNRGFPCAILFGIVLTPAYLKNVFENPGYVQKMIRNKEIDTDEFHLTELKTDAIADLLEIYIKQIGFCAFSQSEVNLEKAGIYTTEELCTPLPHKSIARLAGLGWIGKNNLLVTPEYGSAVSMCTVLTDAPLKTTNKPPLVSLCETCTACIDACNPGALSGTDWNLSVTRDKMINISTCTTCLQCMVNCPWTQNYFSKS